MNFIVRYKILFNKQFGFRQKHFTLMAILSVTDKIQKAIDGGNYACGIFLGLSKAFEDHVYYHPPRCYIGQYSGRYIGLYLRRYSADARSIAGRYIGSMAVTMLADTPPQLDRYVGRVADRGISAVYRRYIGSISVVYRGYSKHPRIRT